MPGLLTRFTQLLDNCRKRQPLSGLLLFKLNWALLVLGGDSLLLPAICVLGLAMLVHGRLLSVLLPVTLLACCGCLVDYMLMHEGVLRFPASAFPLWLALLWFAFMLALSGAGEQLHHFSLPAGMLCGALLGAIGYLAGYLLDAVGLGPDPLTALALIALIWAFLLPLAIHVLQACQLSSPQRSLPSIAILLCLILPALPGSGIQAAQPLIGKGRMSVFFIRVYEASLYGPEDFSYPPRGAFAFELRYERDFSSEQIIAESFRQWEQQQRETRADWEPLLQRLIPDVQKNDRLRLEADDELNARMLHNGELVAEFRDTAFLDAFLGIWLATDTTEPELRKQLLGVK